MAAIKNFFAGIGVYAVPVLSIMAMVLVFYIPRFTEFWNYLRLAPFYAGIYFWISQRPDAFNGISAFVLGIFADDSSGYAGASEETGCMENDLPVKYRALVEIIQRKSAAVKQGCNSRKVMVY